MSITSDPARLRSALAATNASPVSNSNTANPNNTPTALTARNTAIGSVPVWANVAASPASGAQPEPAPYYDAKLSSELARDKAPDQPRTAVARSDLPTHHGRPWVGWAHLKLEPIELTDEGPATATQGGFGGLDRANLVLARLHHHQVGIRA